VPEMKNRSSPKINYFDRLITPPEGPVFHYQLDKILPFRPEPGYDDGPPVPPWNDRSNERDPWDPDPLLIQQPLFDPFLNDYEDLDGDGDIPDPYVHLKTLTHKSILEEVPKVSPEDEINRSKRCRTAAVCLLEPKTNDLYHSVMHCMKFCCEGCGGNGGRIHKRRKGYMYRKINRGRRPKDNDELMEAAAGWEVRYFVFPVPEEARHLFKSPEGLNRLLGVARRLIRNFFPKSRVTAVPHLVGRKDKLKYHPHVNVTVWYRKEEHIRRKLPPEQLDAIKDSFARALRRLGCSDVRGPGEKIKGRSVDMHYSFKHKPKNVLHLIRYVMRPLGPEHLKAWQASEDGQGMIDLNLVQLKGFQFIRNWDSWANCNFRETEDAKQEIASDIGASVIFAGYEPIARLNELIAAGQVKKVGDDRYRQPGRFAVDYLPIGRIMGQQEGAGDASGSDPLRLKGALF